MSTNYLTRVQVAERYPISQHTLAKLASEGGGPRFYKPTDKCLYRPEDVEAWIEAAVVLPRAEPAIKSDPVKPPRPLGRGKAKPPIAGSSERRLKSLPTSPESWLNRKRPGVSA